MVEEEVEVVKVGVMVEQEVAKDQAMRPARVVKVVVVVVVAAAAVVVVVGHRDIRSR